MMTIVLIRETHQHSDFIETDFKENNAFLVEFRKRFFFKCQMMIQLMQSKCAGTDFDTWIDISYQIT